MIVVFDTNIWKSALYLRSPTAAAVRFFLRNTRARVGLPEVVRLEVERHCAADIRKSISSIKDHYTRLLAVFGSLKEVVLPDEAKIDVVIADLVKSVGVEIVDVPFSMRSARGSLMRTIDKTPPSDKTQEFKDGVIWEDCVQLLQEDDVVLISGDRAFYEAYDYSKGLAKALANDLANAKHKFSLIYQLSDLLTQVKTNIELDMDILSQEIIQRDPEGTSRLLAENGFRMGDLSKIERRLYATERPTELFLDFTAEYNCPSVDDTQKSSASLIISGDGRSEERRVGKECRL